MSTYTKLAAEAGDQYLTGLEKRQENYLKLVAATRAWLPKAPTELKAAALRPTPKSMPTPKQLVDLNFSFANKLLEQQKAFAGLVLAASKPAGTPASSKNSAVRAAPATSRATPKASAKKTATKKARAKSNSAKA